jgi:hypothetical protein
VTKELLRAITFVCIPRSNCAQGSNECQRKFREPHGRLDGRLAVSPDGGGWTWIQTIRDGSQGRGLATDQLAERRASSCAEGEGGSPTHGCGGCERVVL